MEYHTSNIEQNTPRPTQNILKVEIDCCASQLLSKQF